MAALICRAERQNTLNAFSKKGENKCTNGGKTHD